jgi:hypothetical protein
MEVRSQHLPHMAFGADIKTRDHLPKFIKCDEIPTDITNANP